MDMQKIGVFLAELRKERNLTQEESGEALGVTNKTVSRWENGNYLPPVEMLQQLSALYGVSINEILSGQKLSTADTYKEKAEANIVTVLNSSENFLGKVKQYRKQWIKAHLWELLLEIAALIALAVCGAIFEETHMIQVCPMIGLLLTLITNDRIDGYVMKKLYSEKPFGETDKLASKQIAYRKSRRFNFEMTAFFSTKTDACSVFHHKRPKDFCA